MKQQYKFEKLQVWQLSLVLSDLVYEIDKFLPKSEVFNLSSQMRRAATSVSLNIAEGSTSASNPEFKRYLGIALRSYIEVYACYLLSVRRGYVNQELLLSISFEETGAELFAKIQGLIKSLK